MKLSLAKLCSHEYDKHHPLHSCLLYIYPAWPSFKGFIEMNPAQLRSNERKSLAESSRWGFSLIVGSLVLCPLPHGSSEKFEQMFRFRRRERFIAALFTSSRRIRFHFLMGHSEQFYQLNCYLGEGKPGILVPMKHDELRKECSLPWNHIYLWFFVPKIRSANSLEQ